MKNKTYVMLLLTGIFIFVSASNDAPAMLARQKAVVDSTNSFTFVVIGDTRAGVEIFKEQINTINLLSPDFVIDVGDLINGYEKEDQKVEEMWNEFDEIVKGFTCPLVMVPGNHDIWDLQSEQIYRRRYGPTYFSFNHKNCHFIVLNTEVFSKNDQLQHCFDEKQLKWLKKDLEEHCGNNRLTFVFLHKPAWQDCHVSPEWMPYWNSKIHPLLVRYGVNAVFAGHVHLYCKYTPRDGVTYYITGGGGAPLSGIEQKGGFFHYMIITVRGSQWYPAVVRQNGICHDDIVTQKN